MPEPVVQGRRGDAAAACVRALVDERQKFLGAVAGFGGKKNDRRVAQEFQFRTNHVLVVGHQLAGIDVRGIAILAQRLPGFSFGGRSVT